MQSEMVDGILGLHGLILAQRSGGFKLEKELLSQVLLEFGKAAIPQSGNEPNDRGTPYPGALADRRNRFQSQQRIGLIEILSDLNSHPDRSGWLMN